MGIVARLQSCEGALLKALPILRWAAMFVSNSRAQFHMIAGDMDAAEQQLISSVRDLLADPEALDGMRSQYLIFVKNMAFLLFSCVRLYSYRLFKLVERLRGNIRSRFLSALFLLASSSFEASPVSDPPTDTAAPLAEPALSINISLSPSIPGSMPMSSSGPSAPPSLPGISPPFPTMATST